MSGSLTVTSPPAVGEIYFDEGLVVGSKSGADFGKRALAKLAGAVEGTFEFEKTNASYEHTIQTTSNTALILDLLRAKDEEEAGLGSLDALN